jgi:hypothetical protein
MSFGLEVVFALVTSVFVAGPAVVLWKAYARTRTRRVLFAAIGFTVFFVTEFIVLIDQVGFTPSFNETETVEFVGDIIAAACFAIAFLRPAAGDP